MMPADEHEQEQAAPRMALRPREAAEALGVSLRLFWQLRNRGAIRTFKVGARVLIPVSELKSFIENSLADEARRRPRSLKLSNG